MGYLTVPQSPTQGVGRAFYPAHPLPAYTFLGPIYYPPKYNIQRCWPHLFSDIRDIPLTPNCITQLPQTQSRIPNSPFQIAHSPLLHRCLVHCAVKWLPRHDVKLARRPCSAYNIRLVYCYTALCICHAVQIGNGGSPGPMVWYAGMISNRLSTLLVFVPWFRPFTMHNSTYKD